MALSKILNNTVSLFNYVGEINDRATFQETVLTNCHCIINEGADLDKNGAKSNDNSRLYIFDFKSIAKSPDGEIRTYLPFDEWIKSNEKNKFWTLNNDGYDFFQKENVSNKYRIKSFSHKTSGSRRMWHYEVDGR